MKIAIIASRNGEKALYLHDFFKEGNRITVDCLLTDNPDSPIAERMRGEGIDVMYVTPEAQMAELAELLKNREVELLVVDDFNGDLPGELKEAFGEAIVYPTRKESGPLEVIETTNRLKNASQPQIRQPEQKASEDETSLEQEWADALNVKVEEPVTDNQENPTISQDPGSQTPPEPPVYREMPPRYDVHGHQPYGYGQSPGQPPYRQQFGYRGENRHEPMPDTYLIWSVILTIVCCLIPGIVAIIYSASVSSKYYAGDIEGAKRASRNAQIWCIVSVVAGIVWATLYLPLTLLLS